MSNKQLFHMERVDNINSNRDYDLFVVTLNDKEQRSWAMLNKLLEYPQVRIKTLVVFDFKNESETILRNLREHGFDKDNLIIFDKKESRHLNIPESLLSLKIEKDSIVGLDITCIPTPHFFAILSTFYKIGIIPYIYYTEPQDYEFSEAIRSSYCSIDGPITTKEVVGFSGVTVNKEGNSNRILICILGFDDNIMPEVIDATAPEKLVVVNGFPSYYPKYKDFSQISNIRILEGDYASRLEQGESSRKMYYVDTRNPFESYNLMSHLDAKYENMCIDVVPMGTKPVALGICQYALEHDNIRVVFPFPDKYGEGSGKASRETWEFVFK